MFLIFVFLLSFSTTFHQLTRYICSTHNYIIESLYQNILILGRIGNCLFIINDVFLMSLLLFA